MGDTGPNPRDAKGLCLLSLDGGGVRGLSTLFILRDVMNQLNHERGEGRHVKPCDVFDLIGGTSTGGLIAIMLGRLEMDVDRCIEAYSELMGAVFGEKIRNVPLDWSGNIKAQFDSKRLKTAIEHVITKAGFSPTDLLDDGSSRSTRVFVCTTSKDTLKVTRLRSYAVSSEDTLPATICEAALATSAATRFFDSATIGDQQFVDGAFGANNPVEEVEEEAADIWCSASRDIKPLVKCFVTLGTGCPARAPMDDKMWKFLSKTLVTLATKPESTERRFMARWSNEHKENRLFRFNVEQGLQEVHMTDFSKRGLIESATVDYLHHASQKVSIRNCILNLETKEEKTCLDFDLLMREHEARKFQAKVLSNLQSSQSSSHMPPPPCWAVPFARNTKFVDREHVSNIKRKLFAKDQAQSIAIVGLGGVGKTQIALEVAYQARALFPDCAILWAPAVDMVSLEQAYQDIAFKLGISFDPKSEGVKRVVQTHLSQNHQGRWLMIFDNADDLNMWMEDTPGSQYGGLRSFLPKSDRGAVVFTTRSNKVAQYLGAADVFRIAELDEQKATRVLHNSLREKSLLNDTENTRQLLKSLTYLPLAIVQAASFINENEMTIASYVKLLDGQDQDAIGLLSEDFEDEGRYKSIRNPVVTTWLTSFAQIDRDNPLASWYMLFMSCINCKDIPLAILPAHPHLPSEPGGLDQQKAIGVLVSYSFLRVRSNGTQFDMHRLVHLATKNWLRSHGSHQQWLQGTITDLLWRYPHQDHRVQCRTFLPHALQIIRSTSNEPLTKDRASLLGICAITNSNEGRTKEAIELYQQAIKETNETVGPDSIEATTLYGNLAYSYHLLGDNKKAIKLIEATLEKETKARGSDSKLVSSLEFQLSGLHRNLGNTEKAEELAIRSVRDVLRNCEIGDTVLISRLDDLALLYSSQGRLYEAEKIARIDYNMARQFLAPGQFWRSACTYTLATCYFWQWKMKEAETLYRDILGTETKILGPEHPTILMYNSELATILKAQMKNDEAVALQTETARLQTKVLGAEHFSTISSYKRLDEWTSRRLASRLRCTFSHVERSFWTMDLRKKYSKKKVYWGLYDAHQRKRDDSFVHEVQEALNSKLLPSCVSTDDNPVLFGAQQRV